MNPLTSFIKDMMETQESRDAAYAEYMKKVEANRQQKMTELSEPYMYDKQWKCEKTAKRYTEGEQPEQKKGYGSVTAANSVSSAAAYHRIMIEKSKA